MAEAYRTGAYNMQAIAKHFRVSRMTVIRAVQRHGNGACARDDVRSCVTCEA